ncbi:pro-FMRFamide-related neuropeptide VF [Brachyistius frenatus]|uniref:pro-FMRFamide-related neuropeptide VF n=1 Tax=Brachyistius frenatus TaxID=100188 RepID=UPI0037E84E75
MLITMIISALLIMVDLGGAAASDFQAYGKSTRRDKTLLSSNDGRHTVRKQPHQQMKSEISRSLDLGSYSIHVIPTASKVSLPTIMKLYPPTARPLHLNANMPLRFGRESEGDDEEPNSPPNMPQRFGRSRKGIRMCADCPQVREAPKPVLPQRFGRNSPGYRLLLTLATKQLLNTGLQWAEVFDFTTSSEEEVEMEKKTSKG